MIYCMKLHRKEDKLNLKRNRSGEFTTTTLIKKCAEFAKYSLIIIIFMFVLQPIQSAKTFPDNSMR